MPRYVAIAIQFSLAVGFFLPFVAQATCSIDTEIPCWHTKPPTPLPHLTCRVDTCTSPTGRAYCCHPEPDDAQAFAADQCEGLTGCECMHLMHPGMPGSCL